MSKMMRFIVFDVFAETACPGGAGGLPFSLTKVAMFYRKVQ